MTRTPARQTRERQAFTCILGAFLVIVFTWCDVVVNESACRRLVEPELRDAETGSER
jgi:hypothetical protein